MRCLESQFKIALGRLSNIFPTRFTNMYVCVNSSYSDIKLILSPLNLWNESLNLSSKKGENFERCLHRYGPQSTRKSCLSSSSSSFNELVFVAHFFLSDLFLPLIMESGTLYTSCYIDLSNYLKDAVFVFNPLR